MCLSPIYTGCQHLPLLSARVSYCLRPLLEGSGNSLNGSGRNGQLWMVNNIIHVLWRVSYVCMYVCMYSSLVGVASEAVGVAFEGTNHKEFFTQVLGRCRPVCAENHPLIIIHQLNTFLSL